MLDPLPEQDPMDLIPCQGSLCATDRRPAGPDDNEKYYSNERDHLVRLGQVIDENKVSPAAKRALAEN